MLDSLQHLFNFHLLLLKLGLCFLEVLVVEFLERLHRLELLLLETIIHAGFRRHISK